MKPASRSRVDLGPQLLHGRDVELADRRDAHGLALRLDVDAEGLELPRHRVRFVASGHSVQTVARCASRARTAGSVTPIVRPGGLVSPGPSSGIVVRSRTACQQPAGPAGRAV